MIEFTNTAVDKYNTDEDRECPYYDECYLQVRQGGMCYSTCKDRPKKDRKEQP